MLVICYTFVNHRAAVCRNCVLLYNSGLEMKFRRREKQIGVRLRSDQHAVLKELAESEGYDSLSEFVRVLLDRAIKEHQKKLEEARIRSPKKRSEASQSYTKLR
jgi:Arc/MetJ-type ribon-helix-helix transcriptional regulator